LYLLAENDGVSSVASSLVAWLNRLPIDKKQVDFDRVTLDNVSSILSPETSNDYWKFVFHFAILGDYTTVRALLALDSRFLAWQHDKDSLGTPEKRRGAENELHKLFGTIDQVMEALPLGCESSYQTDLIFKTWQKAIKEGILSTKNLDKNLKTLFEIFSGNLKVIKEHAQTWQEYFVAQINYCNHDAKF